MIRTLEVALRSGRSLTWWHREGETEGEPIPGIVVYLTLSREELDRRIAERTRRMIEEGLVEEVRRLRAAGYGPEDPGMTSTGYREILAHLSGEVALREAAEAIETSTRQYARRQLTWFRNQLPEGALRLNATAPLEERVARIVDTWERGGGEAPDGATRRLPGRKGGGRRG